MNEPQKFITRHSVKKDNTYYPPGSEISFSDPQEIERLLDRDVIMTLDDYEESMSVPESTP